MYNIKLCLTFVYSAQHSECLYLVSHVLLFFLLLSSPCLHLKFVKYGFCNCLSIWINPFNFLYYWKWEGFVFSLFCPRQLNSQTFLKWNKLILLAFLWKNHNQSLIFCEKPEEFLYYKNYTTIYAVFI